MKTTEQVRAEFEEYGVSVSEWARQRGFSQQLVYQIIAGRRLAIRGQSHQIAVALGLKVGKIGGISELDNKLAYTKDSQEDNLINP